MQFVVPGNNYSGASFTSTGSLTFSQNRAGTVWIVTQISGSTNPLNPGSAAYLYNNNQPVHSSAIGSFCTFADAPAITLMSGETVRMDWTGLTVRCQLSLILYYNEITLQQYNAGTMR